MTISYNLDVLRKLVAHWFAFIILYNNKRYEVDHDFDPPWDTSGHAWSVGYFALEDFVKLKDFLQELTGNTTASYVSGCGLFHDVFEDELREIIRKHVYDFAVKTDFEDDFENLTCEFLVEADETIESIVVECAAWSCRELFEEGEWLAREEHAEIHANSIERQARVRAGQILVQRLGLYSATTICKGTPQWYRTVLILNNLSENELKLISLALNASNSILQALSQGKLPKKTNKLNKKTD